MINNSEIGINPIKAEYWSVLFRTDDGGLVSESHYAMCAYVEQKTLLF